MGGRDLQDAHDARVAVDLDAHGVRDELRRQERLHARAARRSPARRPAGASGTSPEPLPSSGVPVPARSAIETDLSGRALDAHRAVRRARGRRASASSSSAASVEQLLAHLGGGRDHGAAVVERRLRPARAHVPRAGVGVLVEEREVLGLHAEHARPTRSGSAITAPVPFSCAPVTIVPVPSAVELDVRAGVRTPNDGHQPQATPIASSSGRSCP